MILILEKKNQNLTFTRAAFSFNAEIATRAISLLAAERPPIDRQRQCPGRTFHRFRLRLVTTTNPTRRITISDASALNHKEDINRTLLFRIYLDFDKSAKFRINSAYSECYSSKLTRKIISSSKIFLDKIFTL